MRHKRYLTCPLYRVEITQSFTSKKNNERASVMHGYLAKPVTVAALLALLLLTISTEAKRHVPDEKGRKELSPLDELKGAENVDLRDSFKGVDSSLLDDALEEANGIPLAVESLEPIAFERRMRRQKAAKKGKVKADKPKAAKGKPAKMKAVKVKAAMPGKAKAAKGKGKNVMGGAPTG